MSRYKAYPEYKNSGLQWLGEMPSHWVLRKSKYVFNRVQREVRPDDGVVTAFRDGQVTLRSNRRTEGFTESIKEIGYQGVRKGDLLVHAMDGFAGAIGVSDSDGKCSPVCSVCVPTDQEQVHVAYFGYLVRQLAVTDFITSLAKGIRERSTEFRYSEFSVLDLALPPQNEQADIATFLDHETAKIDALIEKQQRLIELLKEKRQAVISHAVTEGLNPNAPMKDSGVEWLGEVPAHWEVSQLRYVVREGTSITYGIVQAGPEVEEGVPYIRTSDMSGDALPLTGYPKTSPEIDASYARSRVSAGDLVISIRASVGKCLPVPPELDGANLTQGTAKIAPSSKALAVFMLPFIGSSPVQLYLDSKAKGATFKEITLETLRKAPFLVPPVDEQNEIGRWVDSADLRFKALIEAAEQAQLLLKERRTALISAAVTGKIDVRDWQAAA